MMSIADRLYNRFIENLLRLSQERLKKGIVLAYSGGPDSSVLLDLLSKTGYPVYPYYFAYFIRNHEEQVSEIDFVESMVHRYGMPLRIDKVRPGEVDEGAMETNTGTEAYARVLRYRGLSRYFEESAAGYIFTAHTLDDDMETAVMRFFQGSPFLRSIPFHRDAIVRPLIDIRKSEIWNYIRETSIAYTVDSTNNSQRYLRNKVRTHVMRSIEEIFPGFSTHFTQYKKRGAALGEWILAEIQKQLPWTFDSDREVWQISVELFDKAAQFLRIESLLVCADRLLGELAQRVPRAFFEELPERAGASHINLSGHGLHLRRLNNTLILQKAFFASEEDYVYILKSESPCICGRIECMVTDSVTEDWRDVYALKEESGPFFLRSRRPGDTIRTSTITKSVKKLYNDWSVPGEYRSSIPVFGNNGGILAVLGEGYVGKNQLSNTIEKDTIRGARNKIGTFLVVRGV